jgi:hypothetical protein
VHVDLRAAGTSGGAPVVANRERTVEPIGHRATGQRAQHVVRAERNARHGGHHFGRRAVLDDTLIARQEKRAVVARAHEREQRRAEGRHRLEATDEGKAATISRARMRWPLTDPLTPISAVRDWTR